MPPAMVFTRSRFFGSIDHCQGGFMISSPQPAGDDFANQLTGFWNGKVQDHRVFSGTGRKYLLQRVQCIMSIYATDLAPDLAEEVVQYVCLALRTKGTFDCQRGSVNGYIKRLIWNGIHQVRAENPLPGHRTRLSNEKLSAISDKSRFRPKLVQLDEYVVGGDGQRTTTGDTVAAPGDRISETINEIAAKSIFNDIQLSGKADLAATLRLMYFNGITLNESAKFVRSHYSTLHRQREFVMKEYAFLVA
jgi:hypothetical protein